MPAPRAVWHPAAPPRDGEASVVLLGHGGRSHKTGERNARIAPLLVRHGLTVVALDGPFHGDRAPVAGADYQELMVAEGIDVVLDRCGDEWLAVIAELQPARVGYLGMSMGARIGLHLAARMGRDLDAAVLGKIGTRHSGLLHPGLDTPDLTLAAARAVQAPTLFHAERQDEIFPFAGQLALYDALGSADTILRTRDGRHGTYRPDDESAWVAFLAARLTT
ncbi:dienelactone hydrolase family protein [Nocardioides sp. WV_118_6]